MVQSLLPALYPILKESFHPEALETSG